MTMFCQSYKQLWKQVEQAQQKDLPQQVMTLTDRIAARARKERQYGQLLKAQLMHAETQYSVAPDSLPAEIRRLESAMNQSQDGALRAVYATVLSRLYGGYALQENDSAVQKRDTYAAMALADPALLASKKATTYQPFIVAGTDSRLFNDDLLSFIGRALRRYDVMHDYYVQHGNRPAACLSALWHLQQTGDRTARNGQEYVYLHTLDSLIGQYQDLSVAGELAIERYEYMTTRHDMTVAERVAWLDKAIAQWSAWPRINLLRNARTGLTNPTLSMDVSSQQQNTAQPLVVQLHGLCNIQQLTMNIYRTDLRGDYENLDEMELDDLTPHMTLLPQYTQTRHYTGHADYEHFEDSIAAGTLPVGIYVVKIQSPSVSEPMCGLIHVSDLFLISQNLPANKTRLVVVNSITGQPVGGARVKMKLRRSGREQRMVEQTCNEKGEILLDGAPQEVYAYTESDRAFRQTSIAGLFSYYGNNQSHESVNLLMDRSIYRPGQTVHVAVLVHRTKNGFETEATVGKEMTFRLRDANFKVVGEQAVFTDEYGKASATFTLPTGRLNGRFSIECGSARQYFRVEEYKRPTFEVTLDKPTESYRAVDTLAVQAKALTYAGVPVQGAAVKYIVKRRMAFWWWNYSYYWSKLMGGNGLAEVTLSEGETQTDEHGKFNVQVPLVLPDNIGQNPMFFHYVVETTVTDQAGETHEGQLSVPLGTRPTVLTCDVPAQLLADDLKTLKFRLFNAAGQDIEGKTVTFRMDGGNWQTATTNTPYQLSGTPLRSGKHTVEARCEGDTLKQDFVVFGLDDTTPCTETPDWFYVSASQFPGDGQPVTVQVGSSDRDVHIVYSFISGDQVIESGDIDQSNAVWNRKLTYQDSYGNGLLVTFAWVKNGVLYRHTQAISRPLPNKELTLRWETFRDRLTPGQQEEWKLVVTKPDGTPADAQLIATLYDKSLEQLVKHQWSFSPYIFLSQPSTNWNKPLWAALNDYASKSWTSLDVKELDFNHFNGIGWLFYDDFESAFSSPVIVGYGMTRGRPIKSTMRIRGANTMLQATAVTESAVVADAAPSALYEVAEEPVRKSVETPEPEETSAAGVQLRENMSETAFFYPALTTDKKGQIALKFTLPESLTTWRFMGIATSKDVCAGYIEGEAVAQKDVMIQPNMPRFVRTGDQVQLSARLFNTSEREIQGTATLQLIVPETQKVVFTQSKAFTLENGATGNVVFDFVPDGQQQLLICQVSATGKTFSDGEQHYLAVLPDRERVTVTVPFTQHEPGVKTVNLTRLFPAEHATDTKLTVEYTNNPAWLMVQALPSVGNPLEHNAIDQAATLYANIIARTLIAQSPIVKQTFEQWKREAATSSSLTSSLTRNEELKDLLLQETPWVLDADRESEQKERLADFFDSNTIDYRVATALEKLRDLQNADGSWSWWPGMQGSFYMTVSISEMLARLNVMAGQQAETKAMLSSAFKYMEREMVKEVAEMKKLERKGQTVGFPSFKTLQYLYICAIDGRQLSGEVKSANDYLIKLLKKDVLNQTIYEKAMTAVILARHGETTRSRTYAQSLKEYTVYTEEMGRYYDTPRAGYSWYDYRIPTEVMAIEALKVVTPDDVQTIEEMQRWLLQEKRTQAWDTPINSVNAVYAFLFDNVKPLESGEQTVLAIDRKKIELPQATAGIGYVKTAIENPQGRELTATKTSAGTSWGAVYAQFMQPVDEIASSASGLRIKREIVAASPLAVGSRIKVRITIESERDLDFVQVIDRRAACMEPVEQLSGYRYGAYCSPKDEATNYYFNMLSKGRHVIETEYYIDRAGTYQTGTCTVQCAYAPEFRATDRSQTLIIK